MRGFPDIFSAFRGYAHECPHCLYRWRGWDWWWDYCPVCKVYRWAKSPSWEDWRSGGHPPHT